MQSHFAVAKVVVVVEIVIAQRVVHEGGEVGIFAVFVLVQGAVGCRDSLSLAPFQATMEPSALVIRCFFITVDTPFAVGKSVCAVTLAVQARSFLWSDGLRAFKVRAIGWHFVGLHARKSW
ncbi:BQ5605_C017g08384 [Microbotryum silenes-dioicae]|uniref:BQ5605_C017g08384 protein n=1 Tax=Microbotryum silenes-dioicae TaxID=796604 RepID=A0A2X0LZ58_9BASI|nr:BQ5605_C017g08384 [Microbotryum silenes-dioicae]